MSKIIRTGDSKNGSISVDLEPGEVIECPNCGGSGDDPETMVCVMCGGFGTLGDGDD